MRGQRLVGGLWHLGDRLAHPPSRAAELIRLRRELARQPSPAALSPAERDLARELRSLRVTLSAIIPTGAACGACAEGHPLPHGRWPGGYCCGAPTADLFTADEIAALHAAGTRQQDLRAPRVDHAGCAFRGPDGCALSPAHRPNICVRHVCWELARALSTRGLLSLVDQLGQRIQESFERFVVLRRARLDDELLARLATDGTGHFFQDILGRLNEYLPVRKFYR